MNVVTAAGGKKKHIIEYWAPNSLINALCGARTKNWWNLESGASDCTRCRERFKSRARTILGEDR